MLRRTRPTFQRYRRKLASPTLKCYFLVRQAILVQLVWCMLPPLEADVLCHAADDESPNIARVSLTTCHVCLPGAGEASKTLVCCLQVSKLGVTSFLVSEAEGVSCRSFLQALQQYDNSHR